MLSLIFVILMIVVFGKLLGLAIKAAWGITKIVCSLILLPIALVFLVVVGLIKIAIPILVIIGILSLLGIND